MNKKDVIAKLLKGPLKVTFTKRDGSIRTMICAMYEPREVDALPRNNSPNTVTVWDAEAQDWRCFKLDTVISIEEIKDDEI